MTVEVRAEMRLCLPFCASQGDVSLLSHLIPPPSFFVWFHLPSWSEWVAVRPLLPGDHSLVTAQRSSSCQGSARPVGPMLSEREVTPGHLSVTVPGVNLQEKTLLLVRSLRIC